MDKKETAIQKMNDFYAMKPNSSFHQREFGFFVMDKWKAEGHITDETDIDGLFGFDEVGTANLWGLGWCEGAFCPVFKEEVLEDRGEYELVRDFAGRHVLCFKGRRNGFMPEYVDHPVKDWGTWERDIKWRLAPDAEGRDKHIADGMAYARDMIDRGAKIVQHTVGGYMYLRSLVGPEGILYMVYDAPDLVHDMMKTWFELADSVIAKHQGEFTLDELFLAEDICYNCGPLISPDMMRSFLLPYYQQLITNIKKRQLDKNRRLFIQIDTDGDCRPTIPIYQEIGMDYMSPFEVASNCDVVEIRKQYPNLLMKGGVDKRILASGREAIKREVERIMPFMKERGGYIPTCDHGVPEEVPFEDYMYYRELMRVY